MSSKGFSKDIRESIDARSKGMCEICGSLVTEVQYHHRRPRGMGGSRKMDTNQCANALALDPSCHIKVESHRKESLLNGWLVSQNKEPIDVPVKMHNGWWMLTHDGELIPVDIEDSESTKFLL